MISLKIREYNRLWELRNRDARNAYRRMYSKTNKERITEMRGLRYEKNKAHERTLGNIRNKRYYMKNKDKKFQYHYIRIKSDDLYRLRVRLRSRLYKFLKSRGIVKNSVFKKYIGCSSQELKMHIEGQFTKGMRWANYGQWHIDHIIPLSRAKTEAGAYKLMHYSNLQPMWAIDNIRKSDKLISQL